jgi:hypothetical protein
MKLALIASLLASAAAFAPASQGKASTALKGYESSPGAIPPVGFFGTCRGVRMADYVECLAYGFPIPLFRSS